MSLLRDLLFPAPPRRRRHYRSRWKRPGRTRFHWHLTPSARKYYFVRRNGRWQCSFCGRG